MPKTKKPAGAKIAAATSSIDIGISAKDRAAIADGLSHLLADTYTLYLTTHNFHWNVTGPMFNTLHVMFMGQYTELWNAVDPVAERIRSLGHHAPGSYAQFGKLTADDATTLQGMGGGHNLAGVDATFTMDGQAVRLPGNSDHFPDVQTNVVPIQLSMGAYNCLQQSDCHAYWEFNYQTNWIHPLYELPYTGGIPGTFEAGKVGALSSLIPGSGPAGIINDAIHYGDNPNTVGVLQASGPRDPDKFDADDDAQREFRQRFIPSGLANEIFLDVYERLASFEPGVPFPQRLFDAYAAEVQRIDANGDGVISAAEGDVDEGSDGFEDNSRLFLPATQFQRFAVTREINDGYLAPRFAPSQRAWLLTGSLVPVNPAAPASVPRDGDDR